MSKQFESINQSKVKKDAKALVTGKPVYLDDVIAEKCLVVKLLRSPHANAIVEEIQIENALKVPGMEAIYTWKDVPKNRFTNAGQTYPEPSPYDRLILDQHVRFAGDPVAILAGKDEKTVLQAMKLIKVKYQVLDAVLDFHTAKDNPVLVHPEEDWKALCSVGADPKRNLCATEECHNGDVDAVFKDCDIILDKTYHTKANQQTMMETFRTYCFKDAYGRLQIESSTQIVFHVRRIVATALGISKSKIRVSKPRIGGGFGAKQTAVCEVYPAFVTWMTGKPSKIIFTREESLIASSPRHEMEVRVRLGAMQDGTIKAIDMYTLSNTGAYGEHGPTTVGLSGHKSIPLYSTIEAFHFQYDVVYTNVMAAGAYRGYGAPQGIFALESTVNMLADEIHMDPIVLREKNMLREGMLMPAYYGEVANSCALDRCLQKAKEIIHWDEKYPCIDMGNGKVRSVGVAMAMQGSCISNVDVGSATVKIEDDGNYTLLIGAADMGTGCDTILAQMVAECMHCDVEQVSVNAADTDNSPYDSGSYASSTTYVTGKAVEKACDTLKKKMYEEVSKKLGVAIDGLIFDGKQVFDSNSQKAISLQEIAVDIQNGNMSYLEATESHCSPVSPPPYMVGMAELEVDQLTGSVEVINYVAVVDCGTVINPNLAKVQVEGGIVQGIGMALHENVIYDANGKSMLDSLMQYKIPSRQDIGKLQVAFESSYEPTGPFGAKSIGEIVIDTPCPAIAHAVYNATGLYFQEMPILPEQIAMGLLKKEQKK